MQPAHEYGAEAIANGSAATGTENRLYCSGRHVGLDKIVPSHGNNTHIPSLTNVSQDKTIDLASYRRRSRWPSMSILP